MIWDVRLGGVVNGADAMNRQWTRTNSSPFKGKRIALLVFFPMEKAKSISSQGNICFDFILGNTEGDSTSSSAQELMLWLEWEGGQLPIGWDAGPAATIDSLFGTSWKVYEGVNTGNGMTVVSLFSSLLVQLST